MEQFHHFVTVFVKEDPEMGKVVQKPCLFMKTFIHRKYGRYRQDTDMYKRQKQNNNTACDLTVTTSETSSCDKIA